MVRRRLLEIDAVFARLVEHLGGNHLAAGFQPASAFGGRTKEGAEKDKADGIAQIVIAVHVGALDVRRDVLAVKIQCAEERAPERLAGARGGAAHEVEAPDPADGAQRDIHGTRPVDAAVPRIPRDPILNFADELLRVALVAGQPIGFTEHREMLAAAELPRDFHVGRAIELRILDVGRVLQRPLAPRLEIACATEGWGRG